MFKRKTLQQAKEKSEEIYQFMKSTTCCFTGHRSQKLPWRFNELDERCLAMKANARKEILKRLNVLGDTNAIININAISKFNI